MDYDVVVIGAGAAGLVAAGTAAAGGRRVLLVEKMEKAGRKIRISGKGRCNLTNTRGREEFLAHVRTDPAFFAPAFDDFDNRRTMGFFKKNGVKLIEERGDRVFPESGKAWDVANALVEWAIDQGAEIVYDTRVEDIVVVGGKVRGVKIITKKGYPRNVECTAVIICTGGVSYPSTGSTGDGYHFAHRTGHRIEEVRPSLVPLESDHWLAKDIVGVQLKNVAVRLLVDGETVADEFGEMEFTRRGLEGAVILRLSRTAVDALIGGREVGVAIDLKSSLDEETLLARIAREREGLPQGSPTGELLRKLLPRPMVAPFARLLGTASGAPLPGPDTPFDRKLIAQLKDVRLPVTDYRPMDEAVLTAGGVSLLDVDPATMQSRIVRGLYFAGEVLDLDADTGGYNMQIAFSTGRLAGKLK